MKMSWLHVALEKAKPVEQHHHPVEHPKQPVVVWYLPEEDQKDEFPLETEIDSLNFNIPPRLSMEGSQQINAKVAEITEKVLTDKLQGTPVNFVRIGVVRAHHSESWYHDLLTLNSMGEMTGIYVEGSPEGYNSERVMALESAGYVVWTSEEAFRQGLRELNV